jgi:predicted DNA-binding transcriptional regulator AlpA
MSKEQPVYITTRQLRDRYGGVSHMWIERRMAADLGFPKPVYFGARRRFWALADLEAWERATAAKPRSVVAA